MEDAGWVTDPVTQVELWVPEHATPESVIRREALRRDGRLRIVRFFPDWCAASPLWDPANYGGDSHLGLSAELSNDLRRWVRHWEATFDIDTGWPTAHERDAWMSEGDSLAARAQQEVWEIADVVAEHRKYSTVSVS